jgi:membrane fusion protein (multidrug efflux system)
MMAAADHDSPGSGAPEERRDQARDHDGGAQSKQEPKDQGDHKEQPESPRQREARQRRKRRILWIAIPAVLLVILLAILYYIIFLHGRVSTDDAYTEGRAIGIAAKVSGYVTELAVDDNQLVRAGDLLIKIDARDYQAALDSARGQQAQMQAQLDAARLNLEISSTSINSDFTSAEAAREQAAANYDKAKADDERQHRVDPRATTQAQSDQVSTQARVARMQLRDADARLRTAGLVPQNIQRAEAQVRQLEGQVQAAQAQVEQAELNLGYTEVRATQDARVTRRNVERGSYVQVGQSLMDLVSPEIWVTANFKETQLEDMRPGQPVRILIDAYPQLDLHGHVDSVQMGSGSRFSAFPAENATGNFVKIVQRVPVKIRIDQGLNPQMPLPLGLSVVPTVDERTR